MKATLTVTHPTVFKKNSTSPSEKLPASHKFFVDPGGDPLIVLASREAGNGHIAVTFDRGIGAQGWNTWTVFRGHVAIANPEADVTTDIHVSEAGINLIQRYEGFRSDAYLCPAGVWTIGFGSTHGVKKGDRITKEQAFARLQKEVQIYEAGVLKACTVAPSQNQFDALVSLAYNIGIGAIAKSSAIRLHNKKDFAAAAEAILLWNRAGGKVLQGLVNRRKEEKTLYLTPEDNGPIVDRLQPAEQPPQPSNGRPKTPINIPGIGTVDLYSRIIPEAPFYWYEATHNGQRIPQNSTHAANIVALAKALGKAREQIGKEFVITSWYRPDPWNRNAGGARRSQHLEGKGADIKVDGETGRSLATKLKWWPGGMGIYPNLPGIIHLDIRPQKARWGGA